MGRYVLGLEEIDRTQVAIAGGKGAHLGELSHIEGVRVPRGFCVTTRAFHRMLSQTPAIDDRVRRLSQLNPSEHEAIRALSEQVRQDIESTVIPLDIAEAIEGAFGRLGSDLPCAVRSSATAEDSATTSFAGQHDTYLNVIGSESVLLHVRRCWASLFTERAVIYRLRNGIESGKVSMAVIVQQMVFPRVSGVLFTADPTSGNRKVAAVEASAGLGEALVSGLVNADVFRVREGNVVAAETRQEQPTLTERDVLRLVELGRRIEAHFGAPQDIEWCLADDGFWIVQSRPITTLFPIPEASDEENHVYVSVGHQQMMTDAMKPLGLSFWQMTTPRPMAEAAGRLFVDVTQPLASPASRPALLATLGKSDPLIADALQSVLDRGDFIRPRPDEGPAWTPPGSGSEPIETDPAVVTRLIEQSEAAIAALKRDISPLSGSELLDFIVANLEDLKRAQFKSGGLRVIMAGMEAAWWLNRHLLEWLGEKNVVDTLTQSVANNVTAEMGLALLDVADAIRPHPQVVAFLERVLDGEVQIPRFTRDDRGDTRDDRGREARDAIVAWLDKYGMRCPGEIDITRPRWSERPATLLPLILANVRNFTAGEAERRFARGREEARDKEEELLARLRLLPDGESKAGETKRMIDRVRTFAGYREYPKYHMISRYFIYKQALMKEAERLAHAGVLGDEHDIFFLRFEELREVLRTNRVDAHLIRARKEAFRSYQSLRPPRVLTSEGEGLSGSYRRGDLPAGALIGLPVSSGLVEGRARVVLDIANAALEPGDILVTAYTDPSWTPLFVAIAGLVTEVGGLMTHGAVIAREYGLPAVVGVADATRLIRDGQRIRVNGTDGYVELLD